MHKIVNRTQSPFDLDSVNGRVLLPALGEVEADFSPDYLDILRAAGTVDVQEMGAAGNSSLRERYEALASRPADKRWSEKRLQAEIEILEAENADIP